MVQRTSEGNSLSRFTKKVVMGVVFFLVCGCFCVCLRVVWLPNSQTKESLCEAEGARIHLRRAKQACWQGNTLGEGQPSTLWLCWRQWHYSNTCRVLASSFLNQLSLSELAGVQLKPDAESEPWRRNQMCEQARRQPLELDSLGGRRESKTTPGSSTGLSADTSLATGWHFEGCADFLFYFNMPAMKSPPHWKRVVLEAKGEMKWNWFKAFLRRATLLLWKGKWDRFWEGWSVSVATDDRAQTSAALRPGRLFIIPQLGSTVSATALIISFRASSEQNCASMFLRPGKYLSFIWPPSTLRLTPILVSLQHSSLQQNNDLKNLRWTLENYRSTA